nr:retrovirus-related Pol polyprotein from transposon TNT 1-94 [Tanacetum cinerariifolium]
MQEELNQFIANDHWELVPQPKNMTIIGTKWVFRNKLDKNGIVSRNKARLVAQGYNQQEGINYVEIYASVARLESIRILLAYACALDFKLFLMDVKSTFLNGFINEEVYVAQPPRFIDFEKPNHVYKLKKALYGLKQALKGWYDRLKDFFNKHAYKIRMVDNTFFTKKKSSNLIIVQIYVYDIIFGLSCQDMCDEFAKIMHDELEMSMMGKLNFFLGLQIKQMEDCIFFNQSKYIKEMLKKFGLEDSKPLKTPMSSDTKLTNDEECESVDSTKYRGMICSLLYLKVSRPDIMFSVCLCARFQEAPKTSHLEAAKCIFQYIKGATHLGLWYPKETGIETVVCSDSDHARDYVDRKSTSGIIHETIAPYTPQQNSVAKRKNGALKEMVNSMLSYSGLSEGFWGEAMLTACYLLNRVLNKRNKTTTCELWFYVIEPNDSVSINSIIESKDAIFLTPRLKDIIPNSDESQRDDHSNDVPSETPEPRKGKRSRRAKSYGSDFQLYLVEGSKDHIGSQYFYCYSIEKDSRTYNEAMQSRDATFWKEAIDDEIGSILENNTYVLSDLPPGCKPLGCKWIFKRKMKVDGTIDKFKARLVIQGFRQKEGIDYFDTYAHVARITTIRLLLALAAIHNLVIYQMDVKTIFLNGDLKEELYMKQPEEFVMPSVINCLYVDDMLIFGTDQNQVDKAKKFLSSKFFMKDIGEAYVILGIKIKRKNKGIVITQSHYIEKILKKFNHEDCSLVSTPMDLVENLKPNTGKHVDQLKYSRGIGCLMYAMMSTRPDIAYELGRLGMFTSNPSRQH